MTLARKLITLLLAAALLFTASACSQEQPSSSTPSSSSVPSSSSIPLIGGSGTGVEIGTEEIYTGVWDGSVADGVTKGGGTAEYPYIIRTAAEFAYAISEGSDKDVHYQLDADIYLNDVSDKNWMKKNGLNQWFKNAEFSGHLDGNGHVVYGIWFATEGRPQNAGLVTTLTNGSIKNLGIKSSFIIAKNYAGAFAGTVSASLTAPCSIENCFVDESVYVQYTEKGTYGAGGLVGYVFGGDKKTPTFLMENCYSKAQLSGQDMQHRVNGLIGTAWDSAFIVKNCYCVGYTPFSSNGARNASLLLSGDRKLSDVCQNVYNDKEAGDPKYEGFKQVKLSSMKGAAAKNSMALDFESAFETVEGGTPKLRIFTEIDGKDITGLPPIKDFQVLTSDFAGGRGTKAEPYVVATADQLRLVVKSSWSGSYFVMNSDIYVNDTTKSSWQSVAKDWIQSSGVAFAGNFDGKGHTVYGLYYKDVPDSSGEFNSQCLGLFPRLSTSAVIRNVNISHASLSGEGSVGAVAGGVNGGASSTSYAVISGCFVDDTVILKGQNVGGIFGAGGGGVDISNCGFVGTISESTRIECGIVADIWSKNYKISNSYSIGYPTYRSNYTPFVCENVYATVEKPGTVTVAVEDIWNSAAKSAMPNLDWSKWKTTKDYPVPKH